MPATATEKQPLTARQLDIYRWVVTYWGGTGGWPTLREVMAAFGIKSPHGMVCNLTVIAKKGWGTYARSVPTRGKGGNKGQRSRNFSVPELVAAAGAAAAEYLKTLNGGGGHEAGGPTGGPGGRDDAVGAGDPVA